MYQRNEHGLGSGGGVAAMPFGTAIDIGSAPIGFGRKTVRHSVRTRLQHNIADTDLVPDLGRDIGTRQWFRGVITCAALCFAAIALSPGFTAIPQFDGTSLNPSEWENARAQAIAPLALGGDTGRRMAANDAVAPLTDVPERPTLDVTVTLGESDSLTGALTRAGVPGADAERAVALLASVADPASLEPGTRMDITLGRHDSRDSPRPLERLALRARFDLRVEIKRTAGLLALTSLPIAVDNAPLRIQGIVGDGLYMSARAAGAPAKAIEAYIRAIAGKTDIATIAPTDRFDIIVQQSRAETGEVRFGDLLYAGLERSSRPLRLMQWTIDGQTQWYDAAGVGQPRAGLAQPVAVMRVTSGFGMRRHPLLGYTRFHQGVDYGAPYGSPIYAVTDGIVTFAGRSGGYGNFVKLAHNNGIGTGYGHMSAIAVSTGARVRQGQVIGYVGSTGLSTGPHLHYELYRNGQAVNPTSVAFTQTAQLSGDELASFRARLQTLLAIQVGRPAPMRVAATGSAPRPPVVR